MEKKQTFAEKHPKLNFLLGLILLIAIVIVTFLVAKWILGILGNGIVRVINYVENFVSTSDQVIVVAMITGAVSIKGDANTLWEMEDIIYEIRKDVGLGRR